MNREEMYSYLRGMMLSQIKMHDEMGFHVCEWRDGVPMVITDGKRIYDLEEIRQEKALTGTAKTC